MKVTITHLKAPWPAGADVGAVVELPGSEVPGCFVGKCVEAPEKAEATHVWTPPEPVVVPSQPEAPSSAEELEIAKRLLAEAEAEADELRGRLEKALADLQQAQADLAAALERATKAEEAAAAKAPKGSSK